MHKFGHIKHLFKPLRHYSRHYSLNYLIWTKTSSSRTIESTPEIITSSDVAWRHVCFTIMKTDDFQVRWLVKWIDVLRGANPVLFSFWLAPVWMKFSIYSGRKLPFSALIQLRSDANDTWIQSNQFSVKTDQTHCSTLWAVIVSRIKFPLSSFKLVFLVTFSSEFNFNFSPQVS